MIDKNFLRQKLAYVESYYMELEKAENKILPQDFAKKIAPVVGLRNRLVHRYEKIDSDLMLQSIRKNKGDFKEYIKYIFHFLEKNG